MGLSNCWIVPMLALGLLSCPHPGACAEEGKQAIDTQFIFGFTAGADVGELGEKEIEHETIGLLGKRGGTYLGLTDQLLAEFVPVKDFRFDIGLPFAYYDIAGVPGFDDVHRGAFDGLTLSARYKLLDRDHSSFALTFGIEPHWSRIDETTGERVENYGGGLSIAADTAIVKDKVFGAINVIYDPEVTHLQSTGVWQREATLDFLAAITTQVQQGVFLGVEARYLRKYGALDVTAFAGDGLFIGPTMFVRLSKALAISGAWDFQRVTLSKYPGRSTWWTLPGARQSFGWSTISSLHRPRQDDGPCAGTASYMTEEDRWDEPGGVMRKLNEPNQEKYRPPNRKVRRGRATEHGSKHVAD